jgi:AraC-like DNA-binding protein
MERKMEAVKELIHQRYYQNLALALIARAVGYSPAYCCNVFSQKEKMSPMAYLAKVRLDAAAKLLAETDLLAKEIAARVGFRSANYFARRFRRVFGLTPLRYRASSAS